MKEGTRKGSIRQKELLKNLKSFSTHILVQDIVLETSTKKKTTA